MWKKKCVFLLAKIRPDFTEYESLSDSVLETKKLQAKVLNSTCRTIKFVNYVNFDGLTFLTTLVLDSQSDYLHR